MRKILAVLLIMVIFAFAATTYSKGYFAGTNFFSRSVCDKPLTYRIGTIDSRFGYSEAKVKSDLAKAETVWETPTGKNLFQYDPTAELKVDFVYDKKQALNSQINQLENKLTSDQKTLEAKKADFEKRVSEFNKQISDLNSEIDKWNKQGGAPKEEYDKLVARQNDLAQQAEKLSEEAKSLNLTARDFNLNVGSINQKISEFNTDLAKRPEEGLWDSTTKTISIFFAPSQKELEHSLAHEMGHALGLGHVEEDKGAIMFPYASETVTASSSDIAAINTLCEPKSLPEAMLTNVSLLINKFFVKTN